MGFRPKAGYTVPMLLNLPAPLLTLGRRLRERPESLLVLVGLVWVLATLSQVGGHAVTGSTGSLLHGLEPMSAPHVRRAPVMTDGTRPVHGDSWDTDLTAVFRGRATVVFDLGSVKDIRAGYVHGDGNDTYVLSVSEDGSTYESLWNAGPAEGNGMRPRSTKDLSGRGRYVRIAGQGGDGRYSIGEVQLFEQVPDEPGANLAHARGLPTGERVRTHMLHFVVAMGLFLFGLRRKSGWAWKLIAALVPLGMGAATVMSLTASWPVGASEVSMARAIAAAVASIAVLREVIAPKRFPASKASVVFALALSGILAMGSFYNLGHLQFPDHEKDRQTFVHTFDMRVYYPVAKYFPELRFDGLYLASVAAYVADVPGATRAKLANVKFRDLETHRMVRADEVWDQVMAMEDRFSPERWEAFVKDMRYFRKTMGPDYIGSMVDHGGNATPVWLAQAYLFFAPTEANETTLVIGGLLDPLLLLLAFVAIGRAYGWRAMFLCMVVWGANDFVMLGSNWAGATLRHDWLAYLMFAVAALKSKRYVLGGILLAMASAARAFPALALVGLAFPVAGWMIAERVRSGSMPSLRALVHNHRDTLRVWVSALAGGVALFLFASLILSFDAWPEWLRKVRLLDSEPHVNQVSLEALVAGTEHAQKAVLAARMPLYWLLAGAITLAAGLVAWRRSLDQAAVLGCLLIPVLFNPANYYIHFITILPLLGFTYARKEQPDAPTWHQALAWWPMLLLCIAQYWTTKVDDRTLHFEMATALLFTAYAAIFVACYRADREARAVAQSTGSPSASQSSASIEAGGT